MQSNRRITRYGLSALLCILALCAGIQPLVSYAVSDVSAQHIALLVGGKSLSLQVVRLPLDRYRVKVGLASDRVGAVDALANIARQHSAVAAINGSFFEAYTNSAIKSPNHHIVIDGQIMHLGNVGTTLGFDANGNYRMERVRLTVRGAMDGNWAWPDDWYAYTINRPIECVSAAAVYTAAWPSDRTPGNGLSVFIRNGRVESVSRGSQPRPRNGIVLVLAGEELHMADRFRVGRQCSWQVQWESRDPSFWCHVQDAIGCGPRLVAEGKISVNPESEGFTSPKILSASCRRSAIGITRDHTLLLVTCKSATIRELAHAMLALGAYDAMNLDGGASTGLWTNGHYLTSPGRPISNALMVVRR